MTPASPNVALAVGAIDKLLTELGAFQEERSRASFHEIDALHLRLQLWAEYARREIGRVVSRREMSRSSHHLAFITWQASLEPYRHDDDFARCRAYLAALKESIQREPSLVIQGTSQLEPAQAARLVAKYPLPIRVSEVLTAGLRSLHDFVGQLSHWLLSDRVGRAVSLMASVATVVGLLVALL